MKKISLVLLMSAVSHSTYSNAAMVTLEGADVDFIFDDSSLFGSATVVGNSLFFQPLNFLSESLDGEGVTTAHQTLNIEIVATTPGYTMTSFAMFEEGDYILSGADASVAASGRLGVTSTTKTCGVFFPCKDDNIFNVGGFGDTAGELATWSGYTSVDLADTTGWDNDTSVNISFQNNLSSTTLNQYEQAFIQKKYGAVGLTVNPIPVPASAWLFISGLLALVGIRRKIKQD